MDNNRKDPASLVNDWLDDILKKIDIPEDAPKSADPELGPDEKAIAQAGLTHPDDMELERIVQETLAENWGSEPEQQPEDPTHYFDPQPSPVIDEPDDFLFLPELFFQRLGRRFWSQKSAARTSGAISLPLLSS